MSHCVIQSVKVDVSFMKLDWILDISLMTSAITVDKEESIPVVEVDIAIIVS
jgi:hypothetical protein